MPLKKDFVKNFGSPHRRPQYVTVDPHVVNHHDSSQMQHSSSVLSPNNRSFGLNVQQENSRIFYANIGREPYMINSYMRPKGLTSYKLQQDTTESDKDFQMRKFMYQSEKDRKCQLMIERNQRGAIRGSMLKDPTSAHFIRQIRMQKS